MKVTNDRTLADLQKDFEKVFPYLRIQFYNTNYQQGRSCAACHLLDAQLTIGSVQEKNTTGFFTLDEDMTVGTFEQLFWDLYGLHIQVFRKSYGKWLQTWATDNWSLSDQNLRSEIMGDKGTQKKRKAVTAAS